MNPLLKYRKDRKLNLLQAAEKFGVTSQCYSFWEREKRFPRDENILVIESVTCGEVNYENLRAAFTQSTLKKLSQLKEANNAENHTNQ